MSTGANYFTFAERARKFVVAAIGAVVVVGDVLVTSDFTTTGGIVAAAVALLSAFGVYQAKNAGTNGNQPGRL